MTDVPDAAGTKPLRRLDPPPVEGKALSVWLRLNDEMVLFWAPSDPRPRIEHPCKIIEYDDERVQVTAAPLLNPDHVITGWPGMPLAQDITGAPVTVRASIACHDCGLHGFVTDGRWESA